MTLTNIDFLIVNIVELSFRKDQDQDCDSQGSRNILFCFVSFYPLTETFLHVICAHLKSFVLLHLSFYSFFHWVWYLSTHSVINDTCSVSPLYFIENPMRDWAVVFPQGISEYFGDTHSSSCLLWHVNWCFWFFLVPLFSAFSRELLPLCDLPWEFNSGCDHTSSDKTRAHTQQSEPQGVGWFVEAFFLSLNDWWRCQVKGLSVEIICSTGSALLLLHYKLKHLSDIKC